MMIFDTPDSIKFFQMCARRGALRSEIAGLKRRGRSAYSICKSEYRLHGSRESVLNQMTALIEGIQQARRHGHPDWSHVVAHGPCTRTD